MAGPEASPTVGRDLPVGVVTFLMTDVESSTRLWRESAADATVVMARQSALIAAVVARHGGARPLEQGEGDSTVAAFARASDALAAALEAQRALGVGPTALVGRVREREEVAALLASDRLVTITGAGGAGKTRLAHAVGEDVADRYADGVVWVELARLLDGAQVAGTIAAACGVRE